MILFLNYCQFEHVHSQVHNDNIPCWSSFPGHKLLCLNSQHRTKHKHTRKSLYTITVETLMSTQQIFWFRSLVFLLSLVLFVLLLVLLLLLLLLLLWHVSIMMIIIILIMIIMKIIHIIMIIIIIIIILIITLIVIIIHMKLLT